MELLNHLSDDQLALAGCLGALSVSFLLLAGSYRLGKAVRAARQDDGRPSRGAPRTVVDEMQRKRRAA